MLNLLGTGLIGHDSADAQAEAGASALCVGLLEILRIAEVVVSAGLKRMRVGMIAGLMTQPAKIGYHSGSCAPRMGA